MSTKTSKPNNA